MMHVPEGDWITWPWAYDSALAGWYGSVIGLCRPPIRSAVLMHLPPLLGIVSVGVRRRALAPGCACRMRWSRSPRLCFALHAFTEYQFGVGSLDHHGAEQLATLGALVARSALVRPTRAACARRTAWALARRVHWRPHRLFVLQLPLLRGRHLLLSGKCRSDVPTRQAAIWFAAALLAGTLLILLPAADVLAGAVRRLLPVLTAAVCLGCARASLSWYSCAGTLAVRGVESAAGS